ncbi:MAG: hypothetical protein JSV80_00410 [Acidobacteriota bacterium]|nr:MAG: hypothetical protein JSV80_00410 [Acidobacteriota bacterium]
MGRAERLLGEQRGFLRLGFAGIEHYAEQRLGMSASTARERAFLARALRHYPLLREAYACGQISPQATLVVLRVFCGRDISEQVEREWVAHAETATIKRLKAEVRQDKWVTKRELRSPAARKPARPLSDEAWRRGQSRSYGITVARLVEAACQTLRTVDAALAEETLACVFPNRWLGTFWPRSLRLAPSRNC